MIEDNPNNTNAKEMLNFYLQAMDRDKMKFYSEESRKNNLEFDLLTTEWILDKVRFSDVYAQHLYAALCNNNFYISEDIMWNCSWRYAGGIIADMKQKGDYIDWYCSGIKNENDEYVGEGTVTEEIFEDLLKLGWNVLEYEDNYI